MVTFIAITESVKPYRFNSLHNVNDMKCKILPICALTLTGLFIISCSEDDSGPEPFSQKSVEENKQVIETSGITLANSVDDLNDLSAFEVVVSLAILLDEADPLENKTKKASKVATTFGVLAGYKNGTNTINDLFRVMKSPQDLDDPESAQEVWDELVGTYTWNRHMEEWDYAPNSSQMVLKFPAKEGGTSNNAELTISNYGGINRSNPLDEEYTGDLPASLNMVLKADGTTLVTQTYTAGYNSDGIPESIAADLTIETFRFEVDLTNNSTEVSVNSKLTHDGRILINAGVTGKGDFTGDNIDNSLVTHTRTYTWTDYVWDEVSQSYQWVDVTETDEWEELDVGKVFHSANARCQVVDIALKGDVDIQNLYDELEALYPDDYRDDPGYDDETYTNQEEHIINKYVNLYAVDLKAGTKIAEAEAYVVKDRRWDDSYNYWIDFRLKFGDESTVDMETYFEEGFSDFIGEVNAIIFELNSEYDWDLDPLEY